MLLFKPLVASASPIIGQISPGLDEEENSARRLKDHKACVGFHTEGERTLRDPGRACFMEINLSLGVPKIACETREL